MTDKIPKETLESMKQFFLKTSIPRLVEKERKRNEKVTQVSTSTTPSSSLL